MQKAWKGIQPLSRNGTDHKTQRRQIIISQKKGEKGITIINSMFNFCNVIKPPHTVVDRFLRAHESRWHEQAALRHTQTFIQHLLVPIWGAEKSKTSNTESSKTSSEYHDLIRTFLILVSMFPVIEFYRIHLLSSFQRPKRNHYPRYSSQAQYCEGTAQVVYTRRIHWIAESR